MHFSKHGKSYHAFIHTHTFLFLLPFLCCDRDNGITSLVNDHQAIHAQVIAFAYKGIIVYPMQLLGIHGSNPNESKVSPGIHYKEYATHIVVVQTSLSRVYITELTTCTVLSVL